MAEFGTDSFVLTVAEGKRLIAKAVAALPVVQKAMKDGIVAVCKGSTNAYVAEELLGEALPKGAYVLGRGVPAKSDTSSVFSGNIPEVIFVKGERSALTLAEAVAQMERGDVVIKGANALNYETGVAGLLVGHPQGGTIAAVIGSCFGKGLHLVIPVGLEKEVSEDIEALADLINSEPEVSRTGMPSLWPIRGEIVTELEALELLADVEAHQIGAGGLCGAEGGSWFGVWGNAEEIAAAKALVAAVQGEPGFGEVCV